MKTLIWAIAAAYVACTLTVKAVCLAIAFLAFLVACDATADIKPAPADISRHTVAELRAMARRAGLSRDLYTFGRKADLIVAIQGA
jgi:hypothetical protein